MIGHLRGTYFDRTAGTVIVDCGGVGYEVEMSATSLSQLGPMGEPISLRIYSHFQKNDGSLTLYGFLTAEERQLFDLLITVKNVGPASAIKILSAGPAPAELAELISAGRTTTLKGLRGVGKKTAELLVVELREKCEQLLLSWGKSPGKIAAGEGVVHTSASGGPTRVLPPVLADVASALGQLGWRPAEVDKAVDQLAPEPDATFEGLLRQALRSMPR